MRSSGKTRRDLEGRRRLAVQGCEHYREALLVVREELVYAPVQVVKERAVPREDEVHAKAPQLLEDSRRRSGRGAV